MVQRLPTYSIRIFSGGMSTTKLQVPKILTVENLFVAWFSYTILMKSTLQLALI